MWYYATTRKLLFAGRLGVRLEEAKMGDLERAGVGCLEHYRGREAGGAGGVPAGGAQAPAVTGNKALEAIVRTRGGKIIADTFREGEELLRHDGAYMVPAMVCIGGCAAAVAVPAGERSKGAWHKLGAENVALICQDVCPIL